MQPLSITLRGITNDTIDPGVDIYRTVTLPLLRKALGLEDGLELKVVTRGSAPGGGGELQLRVPIVKSTLPAVNMTDEGEEALPLSINTSWSVHFIHTPWWRCACCWGGGPWHG